MTHAQNADVQANKRPSAIVVGVSAEQGLGASEFIDLLAPVPSPALFFQGLSSSLCPKKGVDNVHDARHEYA